MSSHHIIRDEQEPALLVLDPWAIDREHLGNLLEWSPLLFATDHSKQALLDWGHKVDYLLTNQWAETNPQIDEIVKIAEHRSAIEETLRILAAKWHYALNLVGNPEAVPLFALPAAREFDLVLYEADQKVVLVKNSRYKKWHRTRSSLRIQPISLKSYFSTAGFIENLENELLQEERTLVTEDDGLVSITSNLSAFLVGEEL